MRTKPYILSVEDNPNDVLLMSRVFEKKVPDHDVVFFPDTDVTEDFLQQKHANDDLPTLILLDIKLIKGNGLDLLGTIKKDVRFKHIPVVMLSSSDREDDKQAAYNHGCNEYVEKPKSYEYLNNCLPEIVNTWSLREA
jgi:CheY-like chemotaxis protein